MDYQSPHGTSIPMEVEESIQYEAYFFQHSSSSLPQMNFNFCPFVNEGCNDTFPTANVPVSHIYGCMHGLFRLCRAEQCRGLPYFSTPQECLEHAVQVHGCIQDPYQDNSYILATFAYRYLRPISTSTNAAFAYYYNFEVDKVPMDIALATVARNTTQNGNVPTLAIAPVHMSSPLNDHFVQFQIRVYQAYNGQEIPYVVDHQPIENEESSYSIHNELCKPPFIMQPYRSDRFFFRALQNPDSSLPRYPVNFVEDGAIEIDGSPTPAIEINVNINILRCIIQRNFVRQPAPYANYWNDLDLPDDLRAFMKRSLSYVAAHNAIIIPQVNKGVDTLIESLDTTNCKNAIAIGILNKVVSLRGNIFDYFGMRYCYALVIVPSNHLLHLAQELWKKCAGTSNVRIHAHQSSLLPNNCQFSKIGADVVITTPKFLSRALELNHEPFWETLTSRLKCIYLEDPHRLVGRKYNGVIKTFAEALNKKSEEIVKVSYAKLIPKDVREALENELYFDGANHFSIGPDPYTFRSKFMPEIVYINENSERAGKTAEIISMHHQDIRWVVWIKEGSTEESIQPLMQALRDEKVDPERVTHFYNDQILTDNGKAFFHCYTQRPDGILVCTPGAHDFEYANLSANVIMYDETEFTLNYQELAVMLSENDDDTFNDIIKFEVSKG